MSTPAPPETPEPSGAPSTSPSAPGGRPPDGAAGRRRTVAAVLAGGTGRRVGRDIPKQLVPIGGRPVIEHTIRAFHDAPEIDEIVVLMTPGFVGEVEEIVARGGHHKVTRVLAGGATRTDTARLAIAAVAGPPGGGDRDGAGDCDVLLHDAARPFVDRRVIADCVAALRTHVAVDVAIPSSDTVITVDESGARLTGVPRRDLLRRVQTPQCFRLSTIRHAYELAGRDPDFVSGAVPATDDCSVVHRYLPDVPIVVVAGSERNIKITHPIDVFLAEQLIAGEGGDARPS